MNTVLRITSAALSEGNMSLRDEARRQTEFANLAAEEKATSATEELDKLRASDQWRDEQTMLGNAIIKQVPGLVQARAESGHASCWIMDVTAEQFENIEYPHPLRMPLEVIQLKLYGAARIVGEYLCKEGLTVILSHKCNCNGVHSHRMDASWS